MISDLSQSDLALVNLARHLDSRGYTFTAITPTSHLIVNSRHGNEESRSLADVFGWSRVFEAGIAGAEVLKLMREANILSSHEGRFRSTLRLSRLGNHLFWHSAFPTSEANAVFFGPDTYRYARCIQQFLPKANKVARVVDIGCGSGAAAVLIAARYPAAEVIGVDINETALQLTHVNAALADTKNVSAQNSNLLNDVEGPFDLIVANPPYLVDPYERAYRHGGGSFGEGLSAHILEDSIPRLTTGGTLLLYTGATIVDGHDQFLQGVQERLKPQEDIAWTYEEVDPDVFGEELGAGVYKKADRIAAVVLTLSKR